MLYSPLNSRNFSSPSSCSQDLKIWMDICTSSGHSFRQETRVAQRIWGNRRISTLLIVWSGLKISPIWGKRLLIGDSVYVLWASKLTLRGEEGGLENNVVIKNSDNERILSAYFATANLIYWSKIPLGWPGSEIISTQNSSPSSSAKVCFLILKHVLM